MANSILLHYLQNLNWHIKRMVGGKNEKDDVESLVDKWTNTPTNSNLAPLLSGAATKKSVVRIFQQKDQEEGRIRRPIRGNAKSQFESFANLGEESLDLSLTTKEPDHFTIDSLPSRVRKSNRRTTRQSTPKNSNK